MQMRQINGMQFYVTTKAENKQITSNFWSSEFACQCNRNHEVFIAEPLVRKLQSLRSVLNQGDYKRIDPSKEVGIKITSGNRCSAHNSTIKDAAKNSKHTAFIAADIKFINLDCEPAKVAFVARSMGFTGIGVYNNRLHVDVRPQSEVDNGFALWYDKSWFADQGYHK